MLCDMDHSTLPVSNGYTQETNIYLKALRRYMSIKIIISPNDAVFSESIRLLIQNHPDMEVIGEAKDGKTAIYMILELSPDVVIIDVNLPDMNGIDTIGKITARFPDVKIIARLVHPDRQLVSRIFKAGASGYLLKDCLCDDVEHAVRTVMKNNISLSAKKIDTYIDILFGANGNV
jgi:DNA-binding NarL/FixJ family response regulator